MLSDGVMALTEAARVLGVTREQVRRYITRDLLPAMKIAHSWVVPAADVHALAEAPPRVGRPLTSAAAWRGIIAGDINLEDPHRYANRGALSRYSAGPGMVATLLADAEVVVSGAHAAPVYLDMLPPLADEAQVYVRAGDWDAGGRLAVGLVADPLGRVHLRAVPPQQWDVLRAESAPAGETRPTLSADALCAPPAAVVLDMWCSPHPREQRLAAEILDGLM